MVIQNLKGIPLELAQHKIELDIIITLTHHAMYKLNPKYTTIIKQDIDKLLVVRFILSVEEATWLSPIVIVPKKNGKLKIYINFQKVNVATKKDPYPLPFTNEMLNTIAKYESFFFRWIFRISSNLYSSKKQIQDCIYYRLGGFYMERDIVWSQEWTSNILKSCY
jgi:hypothetical protein